MHFSPITLATFATLALANIKNEPGYLQCVTAVVQDLDFPLCPFASKLDCFCTTPDRNLLQLSPEAAFICQESGIDQPDISSFLCNGVISPMKKPHAARAEFTEAELDQLIQEECGLLNAAAVTVTVTTTETATATATETETDCGPSSTPIPSSPTVTPSSTPASSSARPTPTTSRAPTTAATTTAPTTSATSSESTTSAQSTSATATPTPFVGSASRVSSGAMMGVAGLIAGLVAVI